MNQLRGFTLIEVLVVIGLIGVLAMLGTNGYVKYTARSRDARRKIDLQSLRSSLELYRSNNPDGEYPTTSEYGSGTSTVLAPAYVTRIPLDPKGAAYTYQALPAGCNNAATSCTSYSLTTHLEVTNVNYVVNPNSIN